MCEYVRARVYVYFVPMRCSYNAYLTAYANTSRVWANNLKIILQIWCVIQAVIDGRCQNLKRRTPTLLRACVCVRARACACVSTRKCEPECCCVWRSCARAYVCVSMRACSFALACQFSEMQIVSRYIIRF